MKTNRSVMRRIPALAFGLALLAVPLIAQSGHLVVPADQVRWAPAPPVLPAGAELAVLEGNPAESGPVTMRLRLPAGYDIPAHWHTTAERITVLSGSLHVGNGDKLDRGASQTLEPGGFLSLPAQMHHFAWTSAPTIVQISLQGPFDLHYVNPSDNPHSMTQR